MAAIRFFMPGFGVPPFFYFVPMPPVTKKNQTDTPEELQPRSLHLVDIENLLKDPHCDDVEYIDATIANYRCVSGWQSGDQVLVAANRWLSRKLLFSLSSWTCRLFTAQGPDGADLRLLEEGAQEKLLGQFDQLVVGSGDGIFAGVVATSKKLGMKSVTVARRSSLSRKLATVSDEIRMMTNQPVNA